MELKDYTTDELKAELKRRVELRKAEKAEEMKTAKRCRNCKYCVLNPNLDTLYLCMAKTWGKKHDRHYAVRLSEKACSKFERKEN